MKFTKSTYYIFLTLLGLTAACLQSCADDSIDIPDIPDYTLTGKPVTLEVALALPEMDVKSRADLDAHQLNLVNNVWVRTYSAATGEATSDWVKLEPGSTDTEVARTVKIESKSGNSYIVAVANVENKGVTPDNLKPRPLSELLTEADTWAKFLSIAVVAPSTPELVRAPLTPLVMAGCYSDLKVGGTHPEPAPVGEWQTKDFQPYFIPAQNGTVNLSGNGAIHLRRLVSHLNFNVIPGKDVKVTVNSYQVMNAPTYSWLYERSAKPGVMDANFGDQATAESAGTYYVDVPQYGTQFVTVKSDGSSSFDFWQAENKHTGTANNYNERDAYTDNPKLFTSLTDDTWTANNEASYVLVSCSIEHTDQLRVDGQGDPDPTNGTLVTRTGEATYLIHLGYIKGEATDFNCYRNVNYTYNLTVNGVNDIRVDAYATAEIYHGEEGMVADLENRTIDIDGHYAAFNIELTQKELDDPNFGFIIIAYENGNQYTITDANDQAQVGQNKVIYTSEDGTKSGEVIDPKYYNWIELRPTTDANVLAQYKPRYGGNSDGKTFLLTDLKGGWTAMTTKMQSTKGYYTVFVNEYTYESMYEGNDNYGNEQWTSGERPAWMGYVNQNPRRFYVRTTQKVSPDGNSVYARSKYGISQQSLMTYYSTENITETEGGTERGSAIAVERVNETEGMNLRHTFAGGTSTDNGRWNTAQWLNNSPISSTLSINSTNVDSRPSWATYINETSPLEVGAVTGLRAQGGPDIPAHTIANGNPWKLPALKAASNLGNITFTDPQDNNNYTIEAINACMSRNRDNNGNGRIEPAELRWYVPAMDKYLQIMLGAASLPEPLMNYKKIAKLPYVKGRNSFNENSGIIKNDFYSRYMIVSSNSDRCVMWLMEGTSISVYDKISEWARASVYPWQVRCVRNLGANLGANIQVDDRVGTAYVHDTVNRKFAMTYYDLASIRTNPYAGNGDKSGQMPIHTIPSEYNRMYYGFEYADKDIQIPSEYLELDMARYINTDPCSVKGTGWRIPNQEELTLMRNTGLFKNGKPYTSWLSCTVNYFNQSNGQGSTTDVNGRLFLIVTPSQGTQLTDNNLSYAGSNFYVRCVRDVMP